jgi:uncharacterized protein (DUF2225 family)
MGVVLLINISSIKNITRVKKCSAGTVVTGDGTSNLMFIVVKGEIGVYSRYRKPDAEMIQTLGSGDLFADPGLLRDQPVSYTSVALGDAIIIPIDKRSVTEFFQEETALAFELMKELFLRLDQVNAAYKELIVSHHDAPPQTDPPLQADKPANDGKRKPKPLRGSADLSGGSSEDAPAGDAHAPEQAPPLPAPELADLFPEGHSTYTLPLSEQNKALLMTKNHTCPICKTSFTAPAVRPSKLVVAATDPDLRYHYKEIEPLYYEVLTCPHCLYSALTDQFDSPEKSRPDILKALEPLKSTAAVFGPEITTESVFAGYYLALTCAPLAFTKYQLTQAKLQYKLSRIYCDAGDAEMENKTALKALDNYLYSYARIGIPPSQEQQICILIGELYLKQDDPKNAIGFFSRARSGGSPVLQKHAENRCYEIREAAKK